MIILDVKKRLYIKGKYKVKLSKSELRLLLLLSDNYLHKWEEICWYMRNEKHNIASIIFRINYKIPYCISKRYGKGIICEYDEIFIK